LDKAIGCNVSIDLLTRIALAALDIPKRARAGLAILRQLPDEAVNVLLSEIEKSSNATTTISGVASGDIDLLMYAINSMARVRAGAEVEVDEFIDDICDSLREEGDIKSSDEPVLRERLAKVLAIESLDVAGKAVALHAEQANLFCTARILTDARPVYGDNVDAPPSAMIIVHTLKIDYHTEDGRRIHEFYVALGSRDIDTLRAALDRAEKKAKSLRSVISQSVRFIDPQQ
jgi:hypothetical protein